MTVTLDSEKDIDVIKNDFTRTKSRFMTLPTRKHTRG